MPTTALRRFRRAVDTLPAHVAPVRPLIGALTFVRSKQHRGAAFRFCFLRVPEEDSARIAAAMGRDFVADFPPGAAGSTSRARRAIVPAPGPSTEAPWASW